MTELNLEALELPKPDVVGDERPDELVPHVGVRTREVHITPVTKEVRMIDQIRSIWAEVKDEVTYLVGIAERLILGPGTGAQKKEYVRNEAMRVIKQIEERENYLPVFIEKPVFWAIKRALDLLIEQAVTALSTQSNATA